MDYIILMGCCTSDQSKSSARREGLEVSKYKISEPDLDKAEEVVFPIVV